jgi:rhodanese-related sulfurtransferase
MSEVNVLTLMEKLERTDLKLIDVREYVEFSNGHIRGAVNIPIDSVGQIHKEIDAAEEIYLISQNGRRSDEARSILEVIGFKHVYSISGGLDAWESAGFPVEKEGDAVWDIERQAKCAAGFLVLFGVVCGLFLHWTFVLIPALVGVSMIVSAFADTCPLCRALFKMPWNRKPSENAES